MSANDKQQQNPGAHQGNVDPERDSGAREETRPNLRDDVPSSAVTGIGHAGRSGMRPDQGGSEQLDKPHFDPEEGLDSTDD